MHSGDDDVSPWQTHPTGPNLDGDAGLDPPADLRRRRSQAQSDRLLQGVPRQQRQDGVVRAEVEVHAGREGAEHPRLTHRSGHGIDDER
jgi:hypothetical protein